MSEQHGSHPLSEGEAYQQHLLRLAGTRDPRAIQADTPVALRRLVEAQPAHLLLFKPENVEYSVAEILGHLADAELVMSTRYRWVMAEDSPELAGYDQDSWVSRLGHQGGDPLTFIDLFSTLRAANLDLWDRNPGARGRAGTHLERGPESYELMFRLVAGHDLLHLDQAVATLEAARAAASG